MVYFYIDLSSVERMGMTENLSSAHAATPLLKGPLFISTVYHVVEVDDSLVELIEPIADAYSFWGRTIISSRAATQKTFFPAPLSYPYRFSDKGLQILKHKLEQIPEINTSTISEQTFPNIPPDQHYLYSADEKRKFLIAEKYISFRIKGWDNIEVMKFPTFVVLAFDHTVDRVRTLEDYRRFASNWNNKINNFGKFENLKQILGTAHKEREWHSVPILTFVAFPAYSEPDFWNYYLIGAGTTPEEVKLRFLEEISLREFPEDAYRGDPVLRTCHDISHEYHQWEPTWRWYYSSQPLFYRGKSWIIETDRGIVSPTDVFPLHGVGGSLTRILRTTLFINVTIPSMVRRSKHLNDEIIDRTHNLQTKRMDFFDDFSHAQLRSFHHHIRVHSERYQKIIHEIDRIDEVQKAFQEFLENIARPFRPPLYDPKVLEKKNINDEEDFCLELFHFHRTHDSVTIGDRRKSFGYIRDITYQHKSIEVNQRRLEDEISSTNVLLESRRTLLKDRENTLLAIVVPAIGAVVFGGLLWVLWSLVFKIS